MKNAIVLCSGGLDSVVTAHYVKKKLNYEEIKILFFNYKQRNLAAERKYGKNCANDLSGDFIEINLTWLGELSSSLINSNKKAKSLNRENLKNTEEESKKWYVPARNLIFLSIALSLADSFFIKEKKKYDIFVGFKCEGKESYPDTTKKFVNKVDELSKISTAGRFKILSPLINKDKEDIVLLGKKLGVDFKKTFSCYVGNKKHCGSCLACMLRKEGFYWANVRDTTIYKKAF